MLNWTKIENNAITFIKNWRHCQGNERQEAQTFEKDFMAVFGVDWHEGLHEYPIRDVDGRIKYIDYLLPGKIIIEMKSKGESLIRAYNQAYEYVKCLTPEEHPELLMVSDFEYIQITNLKTMQTFNKFKLTKLKDHLRMLGILAGYTSEVKFKTNIEVNIDASYKMALLHDQLKEHGYTGSDLEKYLVRILFCLFAEDTGVFEGDSFKKYISNSASDGSNLSARLMLLFSILDTPLDNRMSNLPLELKSFRYINGRLFSDSLPPAFFNQKMYNTLLSCCEFDWSFISPAIFGAMFQGVMDTTQRREMGAHYTSEENILKLIKPLFLDSLWNEFEHCKSIKQDLVRFHDKLASLIFLDPACGCGNFLIITYREIRLLEFEILKILYDNSNMVLIDTLCKIHIHQFYGIEFEEFPCQIAQVGLILMKHQLDKQISNYFGMNLVDFPIRENAQILHRNALEFDWEELISKHSLSYIIGNPPFVGAKIMNASQRNDMKYCCSDIKNYGKLDYVAAWYKKVSLYTYGANIKTAFVSTNSICQGEQASILWSYLVNTQHMTINFAYRTFIWNNDARGNAKVHCIIVGFSRDYSSTKRIFESNGDVKSVRYINEYLLNSEYCFIKNRSNPLSNVPKMGMGNQPIDGGNYLFTEDQMLDFINKEPLSKKYFKKWVGSDEFINNYYRYCLFVRDCTTSDLRNMPLVRERIEAVRQFRLKSISPQTINLADTPREFNHTNIPNSNFIVIPEVSSEKRRYIPIGFLSSDILCSNLVKIIPNATLYDFGILTSNVHMAWMRTVAGRLKSDYRYSSGIVYNNFPWPNPSEKQKNNIISAAQLVLDIRFKYKDSSLADLYDIISMPSDLLKAHRALDKEVCKAYGVIWKHEDDCVEYLMNLYKSMVDSSTHNIAVSEVAATTENI